MFIKLWESNTPILALLASRLSRLGFRASGKSTSYERACSQATSTLSAVVKTSAEFSESFLKHSKSFRFLLSNQETARALTSTPKLSNRASKYVTLLSNFGEENRGLSPVSETGFRHQLVLIPPTKLAPSPLARNLNKRDPAHRLARLPPTLSKTDSWCWSRRCPS